MIIRIKDPTITAEFRDDHDDVVCVAEDMPGVAVLTVVPDTGQVNVPFCSDVVVVERLCDHVRFEGMARADDGSPCGTVSVSVDAPLIGVTLMHSGIGTSIVLEP